MTTQPTYEWFWEERNNGEFIPPNIASIGEGWEAWKGPLADGPSLSDEIFVRELVQNFVDAAREQMELAPGLRPSLRFNFVTLTGQDAVRVSNLLQLPRHADRYNRMSEEDRQGIRLGECDVLSRVYEPLRLLMVTELGTTGMSGPWNMTPEDVPRKMRSALLATVGEKNGRGLGAYGEGKRAIIAASRARTLLVSTCFGASPVTGDITRRLIGATYWNIHSILPNQKMTGLALLGTGKGRGCKAEDRPRPLENEEADEFIRLLDIPFLEPRDPADPRHLGTTHVFIDPLVSPQGIVDSLERNWWPLICANEIDFEVHDDSGRKLDVIPILRDELRPFIEIYESTILAPGANNSLNHDPSTIVKKLSFRNHDVGSVGDLALRVDLGEGGWSWASRDTNVNLVALVRDGMLIQYLPSPEVRTVPPPFVRGVFVTDSVVHQKAARLLRIVEPPLHNRFSQEGYNSEGCSLAKSLYREIHGEVREFRKKFREQVAPLDNSYQDFSDQFASPGGGKPLVPPPRPPLGGEPRTTDPWTNQTVSGHLDSVDSENVQATATRSVALKSRWPDSELRVRIRVSWEVEGDSTFQEDPDLYDARNVHISDPGFVADGNNEWVGNLTHDDVHITWRSTPYSAMWTVKPVIQIAKEE